MIAKGYLFVYECVHSRLRARNLLAVLCVFATSKKKKVYHLAKVNNETLCGQRILPIVFTEPTGSALHFIPQKPLQLTLCKHCERIEQEDGSNSTPPSRNTPVAS